MPLILLVVVFLLQNKPSISQTQSPRENHQTTSQDKKTPDQQQHNSYEPSTTYNVTTRKEQQDDANKMEERRDRKMNLRLYVVYLVITGAGVVGAWVGLIFLIQSTRAARHAADAAYLNAQAVINAERPWVSVFGTFQGGVFTFIAANFGRTPAEVISYATGTDLVDKVENLSIPPKYEKEKKPPLAILTPGNTLDDMNITLATYDTNKIPAPDPSRQVHVFFFRVVYKNPLNNSFRFIPNTKVEYVFDMPEMAGISPK